MRPPLVYSLAALLLWPLLRFVFRLEVRGKENVPRAGGFVLAANHISNLDPWPLGVPLVPAGIRGTNELRRFAKLRVVYGPPVPLDDLAGRDPREAAHEATERLMSEIQRLEHAP